MYACQRLYVNWDLVYRFKAWKEQLTWASQNPQSASKVPEPLEYAVSYLFKCIHKDRKNNIGSFNQRLHDMLRLAGNLLMFQGPSKVKVYSNLNKMRELQYFLLF